MDEEERDEYSSTTKWPEDEVAPGLLPLTRESNYTESILGLLGASGKTSLLLTHSMKTTSGITTTIRNCLRGFRVRMEFIPKCKWKFSCLYHKDEIMNDDFEQCKNYEVDMNNQPPIIMAEERKVDLLQHDLCMEILLRKWNQYGRRFYFL